MTTDRIKTDLTIELSKNRIVLFLGYFGVFDELVMDANVSATIGGRPLCPAADRAEIWPFAASVQRSEPGCAALDVDRRNCGIDSLQAATEQVAQSNVHRDRGGRLL